MKESELAAACSAWLQDQGFEVYGEVSPRAYPGRFDLVGLRGEEVWVVEAKTSFSVELRRQAWRAQLWASVVWAAIPWRERALPKAGEPGAPWATEQYGVLFVEGGSVFRARAPKPEEPSEEHAWHVRSTRLACSEHHRGFGGGQTSAEGGGKLTPWRVFVWELHRALWGKGFVQVGEALDLARPIMAATGYAWKSPRTQVWKALAEEKCFSFERDAEGRIVEPHRFEANGHHEVPDTCAPGRPPPAPPAEQIHFPRRKPR